MERFPYEDLAVATAELMYGDGPWSVVEDEDGMWVILPPGTSCPRCEGYGVYGLVACPECGAES